MYLLYFFCSVEVLVAVEDGDLLTAETAAARNAFGLMAYDSDFFFFPAIEGVKIYSNRTKVFI